MRVKMICTYCDKNKIKKGEFRCDECASKAVMNPNERNVAIAGQTRWRKANGNYTPRP